MKRMIVTMLLAVSMIICLSACGFHKDSTPTGGTTSTNEQQDSGNGTNSGSTDAGSEEALLNEDAEIIVPDEPVEEMEPQEEGEIEIEENLEGTF